MNKQLTAKAPRYSFFFSIKKHPHQFDWYTKNRNDQAFMWICSLLRADKSLNSGEFYSRDTKSVSVPSSSSVTFRRPAVWLVAPSLQPV